MGLGSRGRIKLSGQHSARDCPQHATPESHPVNVNMVNVSNHLQERQNKRVRHLILNFQPGLVTLGRIGLLWIGLTEMAVADSGGASAGPHMFAPVSTPAHSIYRLAMFVLVVTAAIFLTVASLLVYSIVKYRRRSSDD